MNHELVGLNGPGGATGPGGVRPPWRPAAVLPFVLVSFAVALLPLRPGWLWPVLVGLSVVAPWPLGYLLSSRPRPYWRLSQTGLEHIGRNGLIVARYERERIEELALTTDDGILTLFHKFGRTELGDLDEMGFEALPFFITARRLGIPIHVLDGDRDVLDEDDAAPPGTEAEQMLLDQEADLLTALHEPVEPRGEPVRLESQPPVPSRTRTALVGLVVPLLTFTMVGRIAVDGAASVGFGGRLAAGCWTLAGIATAVAARRRLLRTTPVRWTVTAESLTVRLGRGRGRTVRALEAAAILIRPGLTEDPLTGQNREGVLTALVFDHRLQLLARLPARGLDAFQLAHTLDEHGYQVLTPDARILRPSEYGLDDLPEIFAQVPGGRLVVVDDGLGWADAAGDVVLKMPTDRIGGVELLTMDGHAWLRVYDTDGDEFFAAPLSALRISRTDLRESARRVGLPITDAEYDAYLSAAFHGTISGLSAVPAVEDAPDADTEVMATSGPGALLDVTRRSRLWGFLVTVALSEVVAVLGAMWFAGDMGGFGPAMLWSAPVGLLLGAGGAWLYDRNRSQLHISPVEIASVTRLGRVEWSLGRETVGGIGIDESEDGMPRLVVWSPRGRVLRRVSFPPDLAELRRACERYGLPWGPPDANHPAPPPPEL